MTSPRDRNGCAIYNQKGTRNVEIYINEFPNCGYGVSLDKLDISSIASILCNSTQLDLQDNKFLFTNFGLGN